METGSIVSWKKKEGDKVGEGDLLAEIETDKAVMGFEAQDAGFIARIFHPAGTRDIKLGTPLFVLVTKSEDIAAFKSTTIADFGGAAPAPAASAPAPAPPVEAAHPPPPPPPTPPAPAPAAYAPPPPAHPTSQAPPPGGRILASPFAKTLAAQKGIDLATVRGTGVDGAITAKDIEAAAAAGPPPPKPMTAPAMPMPLAVPGTPFIDIPLSGFRKTIAKRLTMSKQSIPHYYLSKEIGMDQVIKLRAEINEDLKKQKPGAKDVARLSVNDFLIKACAIACLRVPAVNSSWNDTFIRQYNQVDVSMAVATNQGLITPIIFNADTKGLLEINKDAAYLAALARDGKLQPQQFQGGTFTISNLGGFGITFFSAVINPPQSCILAVGATEKKIVPDEKDSRGFRVSERMTVTLSCDHRVVDGAVGAEWLKELTQLLEKPFNMLL